MPNLIKLELIETAEKQGQDLKYELFDAKGCKILSATIGPAGEWSRRQPVKADYFDYDALQRCLTSQ